MYCAFYKLLTDILQVNNIKTEIGGFYSLMIILAI